MAARVRDQSPRVRLDARFRRRALDARAGGSARAGGRPARRALSGVASGSEPSGVRAERGMKTRRGVPLALVLSPIVGALLLAGVLAPRFFRAGVAPATGAVSAVDVLSGPASGFERATAPRGFSFPDDHGPHPRFRSEWWYYTGNLADATGRRFGYQLTFFRIGLAAAAAPRASAWATDTAWMAHFALTDVANGKFIASSRLGRGALGLAGATAQPFR